MARTIQEIYDQLVSFKDAQTELNTLAPSSDTFSDFLTDIQGGSKFAKWRLWLFIIAVAHWIHEQLWDVDKAEFEKIRATSPAGTGRWYQSQVFEFQFGDSLSYIDNKYQYATIDPSKQIVKLCAIEVRPDRLVLIKTAKFDQNENTIPLTAPELSALQSYLDKIKFAGTRIGAVSFSPDVLTIDYEIFYDPIVPLTTLQDDLQTAAEGYINTLEFNGKFSVTKFTDALQSVTGVIDPIFNSASAAPSGSPVVAFTREYIPQSGYFSFSDDVAVMFTFTEQTS